MNTSDKEHDLKSPDQQETQSKPEAARQDANHSWNWRLVSLVIHHCWNRQPD